MTLEHAPMGSTTCVACIPWPQWHRAWCDLPHPRAGTRASKPCASEPAEEIMGAMSWLDGVPTEQLTHHVAYTQHRGAMPCAPSPMRQEGTAMGAMPWLVAMKLDLMNGSIMPRPWAP